MTWFIFYHSRPFFYRMPLCVCASAMCSSECSSAFHWFTPPESLVLCCKLIGGFWPWRPWRVLAANTPRGWIEPIKPCPENWMLFRTSLKPSNSMDSFVAPSQLMLQRKLFCQKRRQIMGRPVSRYPAIDEERQTYIYVIIRIALYTVAFGCNWMRLEILRRESDRTVAIIQRTFLPISPRWFRIKTLVPFCTKIISWYQLGFMNVHQKIVKDCKNHGQMLYLSLLDPSPRSNCDSFCRNGVSFY